MRDQPQEQPAKPKCLFSILALSGLLVSLATSRLAANRLNRGEAMLEYGGPGITMSLIAALLLSGLILGQIGLIRGEKPIALPVCALGLNAIGFVVLLLNLAGG